MLRGWRGSVLLLCAVVVVVNLYALSRRIVPETFTAQPKPCPDEAQQQPVQAVSIQTLLAENAVPHIPLDQRKEALLPSHAPTTSPTTTAPTTTAPTTTAPTATAPTATAPTATASDGATTTPEPTRDSHNVGAEHGFIARINRFLPPDTQRHVRINATWMARVEREAVQWRLPRPVHVHLVGTTYVPVALSVDPGTGRPLHCPHNCTLHLIHKGRRNAAPPPDIGLTLACSLTRHGFPADKPLICGCGEAAVGSGGPFWNRVMAPNGGAGHCEGRTSFRMDGHVPMRWNSQRYTLEKWGVVNATTQLAHLMRQWPLVPLDDVQSAPVLFMHSNCGAKRGQWFRKMTATYPGLVDSYGRCFNNRNAKAFEPASKEQWHWKDSEGNRDATKVDIASRYLFTAALENTIDQDYVTEKRYQALNAGSVPIVWRATPGSADVLPVPEAAVYADDLGNPDNLARFLTTMAADRDTYQERFHAWKRNGVQPSFARALLMGMDYVVCRMCEMAANDWDHN